MQDDKKRMRKLLEEHHDWPSDYVFKFIVPTHKAEELNELLDDHEVKRRTSRTGKFISFTATKEFHCADDILEVYERVSVIEGLISL